MLPRTLEARGVGEGRGAGTRPGAQAAGEAGQCGRRPWKLGLTNEGGSWAPDICLNTKDREATAPLRTSPSETCFIRT